MEPGLSKENRLPIPNTNYADTDYERNVPFIRHIESRDVRCSVIFDRFLISYYDLL